ncbi:MAG: hypothetical protein AAGJ58_11940, partial [Pseudomonadota bacterium]
QVLEINERKDSNAGEPHPAFGTLIYLSFRTVNQCLEVCEPKRVGTGRIITILMNLGYAPGF